MTFHCFLNTSVCRSISLGLSCLLWRASFTPEPWQQVSCHSRGGLALKYLWFFSVVIAWVLTAVARYCDPSPNKRPDVLLSVVTWRGETECMLSHHTSSLQTPNSSPCIKDRFYWSSSISVWCFFLLSFLLFHYLFSSNPFMAKCVCPLSSLRLLFPLSIKSHFLRRVISAPHS